ncbi:hypothetical protein B0H10DRAFT_734465 [Mycena sp. CBHHK59/15]|nr:hypothetical protein B0H10DRAFT_923380 [Mycena sp. CBHHK59/15]KAJ6598537.1 hypothetical protein B0H10DRAFT_734465 [Mycena sp. CBHHK59/15]
MYHLFIPLFLPSITLLPQRGCVHATPPPGLIVHAVCPQPRQDRPALYRPHTYACYFPQAECASCVDATSPAWHQMTSEVADASRQPRANNDVHRIHLIRNVTI